MAFTTNPSDAYVQTLISRNGYQDISVAQRQLQTLIGAKGQDALTPAQRQSATTLLQQGTFAYAILDTDGRIAYYANQASARDALILQYLISQNG